MSNPSTFENSDVTSISSEELSTLNEPVLKTILRDLTQVKNKLRVVLHPSMTPEEVSRALLDWDLWGPLLLGLTLAILMSYNSSVEKMSSVFATVFVIVWLGAFIVTLNANLLGGKVSLFQCLCVLGYSMFPIIIAGIICTIIPTTIFSLLLLGAGCFWSCRAAVVFVKSAVPETRKYLGTFPILLFYIAISWSLYAVL